MTSPEVQSESTRRRSLWSRLLLAFLNLLLAGAFLWLGMSIPSYFRSVSPLVLEAAAEDSPDLLELSRMELQAGQPGPASMLVRAGLMADESANVSDLEAGMEALFAERKGYRWSGGPAPFFEQFVERAEFLRQDETAVIPSLLPGQHRQVLGGFLEQSPNRNVLQILETRNLGGWQRFYPVYSTSGHPLEATILTLALLEQASAFPQEIRSELLSSVTRALDPEEPIIHPLESICLGTLTLGRHTDWLQLKSLMGGFDSVEQLIFAAQSIQEDPNRLPILYAAITEANDPQLVVDYLLKNGDRGWEGLTVALGMGLNSMETLLTFNRPLYIPPTLWKALPQRLRDSQQHFKEFAENFPVGAIGARALAFAACGICMVGILRSLILNHRPRRSPGLRILINLDSVVGGTLVMLLVWVLIEPGLLDFRPNEEGSLQINLAQVLPDDSMPINETLTKMIDQVTILVLLLFFVAQLLVFIFCLLKITEVKRQRVEPSLKLKLLDNEENLFDLGLYVGLGGTVASLILVVLNVVDASLMAAYASTLFGIIFVALLKVGFLRPYRRQLILQKN